MRSFVRTRTDIRDARRASVDQYERRYRNLTNPRKADYAPAGSSLQRARLSGRREALDIIKTKLSDGGIFALKLTSEGEDEILGLSRPENESHQEQMSESVAAGDGDIQTPSAPSRVLPGTVRPAIITALSTSQGRRPSEVTAITHLKENTVRGTLRALGIEGLAVKRGDLWLSLRDKRSTQRRGARCFLIEFGFRGSPPGSVRTGRHTPFDSRLRG